MPQSRLTICIVDDEQSIVDLLNTYFSEKGYTVHGFTQSTEAREFLKSHPVDIVFTDLKMPDVTGLDIADTVNRYQKDAMIIIFTGYASIDSAIRALQQGVYDYLRKPFKLTEIQAVINRAVEKLLLGRENIRLQKQIEKMLADITMLYEISSILYQVQDLNLVGDMILDTLTEGMGVSHAGIYVEKDIPGSFFPLKFRGLPAPLVEQPFNLSTEINGVGLDFEKTQVIPVEDGQILLNGHPVSLGKENRSLVAIPVQFMNQTLGYLCVLDPREGLQETEDDIKLYKIIATQISPLLFSHRQHQIKPPSAFNHGFLNDLDIVHESLNHPDRPAKISYILLQLHQAEGLKAIPREDMNYCVDLLKNEFGSLDLKIKQFFNYIFCVLPGANPIETELKLMDFKAKFDHNYNGTPLLLRCGLANYPTDGQKPRQILDHLIYSTYNEFPESARENE